MVDKIHLRDMYDWFFHAHKVVVVAYKDMYNLLWYHKRLEEEAQFGHNYTQVRQTMIVNRGDKRPYDQIPNT